jgi:hypothetical protein
MPSGSLGRAMAVGSTIAVLVGVAATGTAGAARAHNTRSSETVALQTFLRRSPRAAHRWAGSGAFVPHAASRSANSSGQSSLCVYKGYFDPRGDGGALDATGYSIGYDCLDHTLFLTAVNANGMDPAAFGAFSMIIDTDIDDTDGCGGGDVAIVATNDGNGNIVSGAVTTPSCDTTTWTVRSETVTLNQPDSDSIQLAFPSSVAVADTFRWYAALADTANAVDFIPDSGWRTTVMPDGSQTAPGPATAVHATATDGNVVVSFGAPLDDGGDTITSYDIILEPIGQVGHLAAPGSAVFSGLTDSTSYYATVLANNDIGASAPASSNTVVPTGVTGQSVTPFRNGATATVNGSYRPVVADFDPTRTSDILWYAPGRTADPTWIGRTSGGFANGPTLAINGTYEPIVGDFNCDGSPDIVWYGPGTAPDSIWWMKGFKPVSQHTAVDGVYRAAAGDFNGDDCTDILWHGPGTAPDSIWVGSRFEQRVKGPGIALNGAYELVVGDFNGDGYSDVLLYAPGRAQDHLLLGGATGFAKNVPVTINGTYTPVVGDFDGDGYSDVIWYAPGSAHDYLWRGGPHGFTGSLALTINGKYDPIASDFNGDGHTDVLWYAPGPTPDPMWLGST